MDPSLPLKLPAAVEMDMNIEMDIPLPEELEWLEANTSHFDDDLAFQEEDYEIVPPEDGEESQNDLLQSQPPSNQQKPIKPTLSIPSKPTPFPPQIEITARKRFRSAAPDSPNPQILDLIDEKQSRIEVLDLDLDGDGIELLPPPKNEVTHVDETEEDVMVVEKEEKFIYRYASEIDGDFVPVTGPGGEQVYAKICRFEVENRLKKLGLKSRNNSLIAEPINVLMQCWDQD